MLTYATVRSAWHDARADALTPGDAGVSARHTLTCAHVCCRMLTYADALTPTGSRSLILKLVVLSTKVLETLLLKYCEPANANLMADSAKGASLGGTLHGGQDQAAPTSRQVRIISGIKVLKISGTNVLISCPLTLLAVLKSLKLKRVA